jgi:PAS domain S-box-containing protein
LNKDLQNQKLSSTETVSDIASDEFKSLVEISGELIFSLDYSGHIKTANQSCTVLLGYQPSEIVGQNFLEFVKPSSKSLVLKAFQSALAEKKVTTFEAALLDKHKVEVPFKFRIKTILEGSDVKGLIGTGRSMSFLKKLEDKITELNERLKEANRIISIERTRGLQKISLLEELNRMKAEFISNISHEFRTPLASIIGFSESIASDPSMTQEHKKEFNDIILSEGKRLAKLINDVLDLTRLEKGEISLNKTNCDCVLLLRKIIEKNLEKIKNKGLHLTYELPEEIYVEGDKDRLEQMFSSLLSNAIKYTGKEGRISIFAQSLYKEFEVIITDTGIGISKKDLPYIFQKYFKDNKSVEQPAETGLGLVFVKQIVDLHKGSISIQSELNKGTTVIVKLVKTNKK